MGLPGRGKWCVMAPGGRSGWMSGKVRRYGVDYFGLPWQRRLIRQYPAGFSLAAVLHEREGDTELKMRTRLVSFSKAIC